MLANGATLLTYGKLFDALIAGGSEKFVDYCALQGRTEAESVRYGTAAAGIVNKLLAVSVIKGGLKVVGGKKGSTTKTLSRAEASARAKEVFHAKAVNENTIRTEVSQGIFDAVNKAPYNSRAAQNLASRLLGTDEFTRTTVPGQSMPNVRLAGQCKERTVVVNPETQETLVQRVVFDQRGFPIFDPYVKVETRISGDLANMLPDAHMRAATRQLREDILSGKISKTKFTDAEWDDIKAGLEKIGDYTWHHHQETGKMQLIPTDIHDWISHIGGNNLWGIKK